ncbi:MAG: hypothetical protein AAF798_05440 [Bacteroidota bacterium]
MFIPPSKKVATIASTVEAAIPVQLRSDHLLLSKELAREVFGEELNVYLVHYPDRKVLMLARISDKVFKSLHKTSQHMLKNRNLAGDKTIAIHDILIDQQIDRSDRPLSFEFNAALGILSITI